jgi:hypothetical protein
VKANLLRERVIIPPPKGTKQGKKDTRERNSGTSRYGRSPFLNVPSRERALAENPVSTPLWTYLILRWIFDLARSQINEKPHHPLAGFAGEVFPPPRGREKERVSSFRVEATSLAGAGLFAPTGVTLRKNQFQIRPKNYDYTCPARKATEKSLFSVNLSISDKGLERTYS